MSRLALNDTIYREIFENSRQGVMIGTLGGKIVIANRAFAQLLGYPSVDALQREVSDIGRDIWYYPDERLQMIESLREKEAYYLETRFRHRSGSSIWVSVSAHGQWDEDGRLVGVQAMLDDISERKWTELALQESERRFQQLIEQTQEGYWLIDADGISRDANPAMCRILQRDRAEVVGKSIYDHVDADGAGILDSQLNASAARAGGAREIGFLRPDGSAVPCLGNVTPIFNDDGKRVAAIGLWADITALKQATRDAEAASVAKSNFLANMSHEIRTPLTAVLGVARIGLRDSREAESIRAFEQIVHSGEHLLDVINDVLDFSRIEANMLTVDYRDFPLREAVADALDLQRGRALDKGLAVEIEIAADLPGTINGDPVRFRQILINLVSNAIKFTPAGRVRLELARRDAGLALRVIDTGIGIEPARIERLFAPFEQGDASATRDFGGSGLGLVICRNLARLMGGDIAVQSQPGEGSVFEVWLPLREAARPAPVTAPGCADGHGGLRGLKVLAVDDVEINRVIIGELLEHEGARVTFAENGRQALDLLNGDIDLVLMDIQMPVMDGFEATRRIREIRPGLPVIGLTAHAFAEERERCLAAGMVEHVAKPIDPDRLIGVIVDCVSRRRPG